MWWVFSAKTFSLCCKQALVSCWLQPIEPHPWVHGGWSSQEPAKWRQHTPVQLREDDEGVIAVDLEEAVPEERARSLPGLELNTVEERAYTISYSLLVLFAIRSCLMVKKKYFAPSKKIPPIPPLARQWTQPVLIQNSQMSCLITCFAPSMGGGTVPSCMYLLSLALAQCHSDVPSRSVSTSLQVWSFLSHLGGKYLF